MLKYIVSAIAIMMVIFLATGCSSENTLEVSLGKEFSLAIGQSASISDERLSVKFLDVTEDSRCPKGVTCIWAGQVSCEVEVIRNGNIERAKLTALAGRIPASQIISGYSFAFNIEPYPEANNQITKEEYRLSVTIAK
jgi:hypothetical protein